MINYSALIDRWHDTKLAPWAEVLQSQIDQRFNPQRYGDLPRWLQALQELPDIQADAVHLNLDTVSLQADIPETTRAELKQQLRTLHPWRKGPFDLFEVHIDTEWRSDWKWQRLLPGLADLHGRRVLDVGCGSGYHCWRMLGAGAAEVIGIDPTPLFVVQFWALQKYIQNFNAWVLPLGIEHLPHKLQAFDTVFSMGVLYHRRSPMDHLQELRDCLRPGGQLLLETLVIEGDEGQCLVPEGRYARMGNVWFLPTTATLTSWLRKIGWRDIELVDVSVTSVEEQRSTDWMTYQSLGDFLDPEDSSRTIEGYPAPRRAIVSAIAP